MEEIHATEKLSSEKLSSDEMSSGWISLSGSLPIMSYKPHLDRSLTASSQVSATSITWNEQYGELFQSFALSYSKTEDMKFRAEVLQAAPTVRKQRRVEY